MNGDMSRYKRIVRKRRKKCKAITQKTVRQMLNALVEVVADHEARLAMYPTLNNQPNRLRVMQLARQAIKTAGG